MVTAYNGWPAAQGWSIAGGQLAALVIDGESFSPGILAGDVHTVFQYFFNRVNAEVEPIYAPGWHTADEWGYYYKTSANSASLISVHSAACACDYNATRHPNGRKGTFSAAQVLKLRAILADFDGVIYWGGDGWGSGTWDEMHFEIATGVSRARVTALAKKLRGGVTPTTPPPGLQYETFKTGAKPGSRVLKLGSAGDDVKFVQRWHALEADGYFGPQTEAKVKATQTRNHLPADGIVGPATFALMGVGVAAAPARPRLPAPPAWDIPVGQWLGHIAGPAASHGGGSAIDRDNVLWWQRMLIATGCVAGQTDPNSAWADAEWEDATTAATRIWFRRFGVPNARFTDRCYRDDWNFAVDLCKKRGLL